jgi:hypothetical protein
VYLAFHPYAMHSVFFGPFLSGCFFPPNDRAQNHAQENPLLVLFMLGQGKRRSGHKEHKRRSM